MVSFLRKAADDRPLLVVLDDLHAADPTSLLMLIAVSRQIHGARVTVIGTYREVEVKHLPELAALITEAEREGVVLPLRGLGEVDIGEFVQRTWGVWPPARWSPCCTIRPKAIRFSCTRFFGKWPRTDSSTAPLRQRRNG